MSAPQPTISQDHSVFRNALPLVVFVLALVGGYLSLVLLQMDGIANDPGLGWHLQSGAWRSSTGVLVPELDPFLSIARPWISDQWLADRGLAALLGCGWPLLYATISAIFLLTFFLTGFATNCRRASVLSVSISALFALKISTIHFIVRPVVVSFLLFAFLYGLLREIYQQGALKLWQLALVPVLFVIWANIHPSFALGLGLILLLICSCVLERFLTDRASFGSKLVPHLLLLLLTALLGTLATPHGLALHRSIFSLGSSNFFMSLHQEWRPIDLTSSEGQLFAGLLGFVLVSQFFTKLKVQTELFEQLMLLLFAYLTLRSVRFLPYFSLVLVAPLAVVLQRWLGILGIGLKPDKRWLGKLSRVASVIMVLGVILATWGTSHVPLYSGGYGPSKEKFPYQAVQYLLGHSLQGAAPPAVFAPPEWGGFITWASNGKLRPTIDDRNTLLGEQLYRDYLALLSGERQIWQLPFENSARLLLLPLGPKHAKLLSGVGNAKELYRDGLAVVYEIASAPQTPQ